MNDPSPWNRREATYAVLLTSFCVVLVLTNIVGVKLFHLFPAGRPAWLPGEGPLTLTSGIITYPLTFVLTDLVAEIWGRRRANFMVILGFVMSLLMLGIIKLASVLPASDFWSNPGLGFAAEDMQLAFEASFSAPGVLLLASMSAYLVAQLLDVRLYHFWWRLTGGRHLWLRNNGSTMISQLVDTIIVNSIFLHFAFKMSWGAIGEVIVVVYICKVLLAMLDTPLIYMGRSWLLVFLSLPREANPQRAPLE